MMREDELDDDAFQIRHVFALFGAAAFFGQVLETGLINLLTMAQTSGTPNATTATFDNFIETNLRATMGQLLKLLRPYVQDDDDLVEHLKATLETRNSLAHHFFRDHDADFMSVTGRELMLAELIVARDDFEQIDKRLEPVLDRFFASRGLDRETRVRWTQESYDQMHAAAVAAGDN